MAYSIPEYVDTPEQAILAVASAVKGEEVTGGDGSVNGALDILADALAGEDVEVPMTQQGAILALAQYVSGMVKPDGTITITENGEGIDVAQYATADVTVSGGGVDLGPLGIVAYTVDYVPTVGNQAASGPIVDVVKFGDTTVLNAGGEGFFALFAAGLTLTTMPILVEDADTMDAYVCTFDAEFKYATVEPWDGTLTRTDAESQGSPAYTWTFTMPELRDGERQDGEWLVLWAYLAD